MSNRKQSQLRCGLILLCPIWFGLLASRPSSKLSACDEDKLLPFPSVRFPWTFHFLGVCCLNSLLPKERHQCLFTAPQDSDTGYSQRPPLPPSFRGPPKAFPVPHMNCGTRPSFLGCLSAL